MSLKEFRVYKFTVPAGGVLPVHVTGKYIACLSATGTFQIGLDGEPATDFFAGLKARLPEGEQFKLIRLKDTSGAANTIEIVIGHGDFTDSRLVLSGGLSLTKATNFDGLADVTVGAGASAVIMAAKGARREAIIANTDATITVRIGGAGVGAANGIPLAPGATLTLATSAEISAYNPGGAAVVLALAEVMD